MISLYGYPKTRARRVTWMLEELGAAYEFKLVRYGENGFKTDELLALNPAGKVPALVDDGFVLTESAAILTYLGDKFPDSGLVPAAGTQQRGLYDQWCYFVLSELEQPLWTIGKHKFALPEQQRIKEIFPTAAWEFQQALQLLSQGLGEASYILGESFSAADILIGHTLRWGENFDQPIEQGNVRRYADRVLSRDALARAVETEEATLQG